MWATRSPRRWRSMACSTSRPVTAWCTRSMRRPAKSLWRFDPGVTKVAGKKLRAGAGVRGLAYSNGTAVRRHARWPPDRARCEEGHGRSGARPRSMRTTPASFPARRASSRTRSRSASAIRVRRLARVSAFDIATGKRRRGAGKRRAAVARSGTPSPTTRTTIACMWEPATRAAPMPRKSHSPARVVALNADTGATGLALRYGARRSPAMRRRPPTSRWPRSPSTASLTTSSCTRRKTAPSTCSIAPRGKAIIASKKLGMGAHNHFAQSFSPKTGPRLPADHRVAGIESSDGDAPRECRQERAGCLGSGEAARGMGQSRRRARSAAACFRPPATWSSRDRPTATSRRYSAADGRRVWAFYSATAALGAPISFAIGKRQYISILNGPTQGTAGSLGAMSARFGWDSRAHPRRLLTFVLDGTGAIAAHARSRPSRRPVDGADLIVDETLAKEGAQLFTKCQWCHGAGAIAGGGGPICGLSLSPLVAAHLRAWCAAETKLVECRSSRNSAIASSTPCGTTFARGHGRVTRPDGVAPPAPDAPAPAPAAQPEEQSAPKPPPGSLESTGLRRPDARSSRRQEP